MVTDLNEMNLELTHRPYWEPDREALGTTDSRAGGGAEQNVASKGPSAVRAVV